MTTPTSVGSQEGLLTASRFLLLGVVCVPLFATVNVRDFGAQGDGIANDTAAVNAAFKAGCAASDSVYLAAGTYLVDSLDPLRDCGISFYGEGRENSILRLRSAQNRIVWSLTGSHDQALTIEDLALDGEHLASAGIAIEHYQAVTINRVFVHDCGTPGYHFGHRKPFDGVYIRNSENVRISNSQFTGNERAGIELQAIHNSRVQDSILSFNGGMGGVSEQNFEGALDGPLLAHWADNTIVANGSGGIDVETDAKLPPAQGILERNRVLDCGNDQWDSGWGLVLGLNAFGSITGNTVERFAAYASPGDYTHAIVYVRNGGLTNIANNTITGTRSHAILGINTLFPVTISGNTLSENGTGIYIYNSPRIRIAENSIAKCLGPAIEISLSSGSTVIGNLLSNNLQGLRIDGRRAIQLTRLQDHPMASVK